MLISVWLKPYIEFFGEVKTKIIHKDLNESNVSIIAKVSAVLNYWKDMCDSSVYRLIEALSTFIPEEL